MKNRRSHYFINKSFQTRYGIYIALTLLVVCGCSFVGLYFGIWSSVLESFSDSEIRNALVTAAQIHDYQTAREPVASKNTSPSLRVFQEVNLLSERQREILWDILVKTNQRLFWFWIFLILLIGMGSVYLTHAIAGPYFRFQKSLEAIKNGDLTVRTQLRKSDEGTPVATALNEMAETLDKTIGRVKKNVREAGASDLKSRLETDLDHFQTTDH